MVHLHRQSNDTLHFLYVIVRPKPWSRHGETPWPQPRCRQGQTPWPWRLQRGQFNASPSEPERGAQDKPQVAAGVLWRLQSRSVARATALEAARHIPAVSQAPPIYRKTGAEPRSSSQVMATDRSCCPETQPPGFRQSASPRFSPI